MKNDKVEPKELPNLADIQTLELRIIEVASDGVVNITPEKIKRIRELLQDVKRAYNREWYQKHIDRLRVVNRDRARKYRIANPERVKKQEEQKRIKDYRKRLAHSKVHDAVKIGKLTKPSVCSRCPNTERIEGHHPDYSKPLEVIWLCNICHLAEHKLKDKIKSLRN